MVAAEEKRVAMVELLIVPGAPMSADRRVMEEARDTNERQT